MHPDLSDVLFTEEQIANRVKELGDEIYQDYHGEPVLVIGVLKGAAIFMADLVRAIPSHVEIDFMAVSSYGNNAKTSGVVRIIKDLDAQIANRHVIIAEDVLDSGLTLKYLLRNLATRNPKSLEVCCLLRKPQPEDALIRCKYVGFECPDEFVVGYGLDYAEQYRNLPYVGALRPSVYE